MARRERNIYKRADGRWEGRHIKDYGGAGGRARYASVYGRSYAEAKRKLMQRREEKPRAGAAAGSRPLTVREAVEAHLAGASSGLKRSTLGLYERYLERYIAPYFGNARSHGLQPEAAQGFVDSLAARGLSAATVQSVFSLLRVSVCGTGGAGFPPVRLPKRFNAEAEAFSVEEQRRLEEASAMSDDLDRAALKLSLYTGLRVGELCGLMWQDIDFGRRQLCVRRTLQRVRSEGGGGKTEVALLAPKSRASERTVPLAGGVLQFLAERHGASGSLYVLSRGGAPVEPRVVQYRFKKLLRAAGLRDVNFHTTRHTFVARALESGCDIKTLSEFMGHASATVTLNRYAHILDDRKRAHMEAIAAVCV
jgi:integrase